MQIKIATFLYHEVTDDPSSTGFQRTSALPYKHKISEFEAHLQLIVAANTPVITLPELDLKRDAKVFMITFDDGGKSNMLIADMLEKYGLRGHFFIATKFIGDPYFLKGEDIKKLHQRGHIIGSHSHSHPNVFKSLTIDQMVSEWLESKLILEKILGTTINSCSIPGGDVNKDAYLAAYKAGYTYVFNSEPITRVIKKHNLVVLGRICPKQGLSLDTIKKLTHFQGIYKMYVLRILKNTIKKVIFPIYATIHNNRKHAGK